MPPGLDDPSFFGMLVNVAVVVGIISAIGAAALVVWFLAPISSTALPSKASSDIHSRLTEQE